MSLSDNRLVQLKLKKLNEIIDVKLIFASVHMKHHFAELLQIENEEEKKNNEESKLQKKPTSWK